MVVLPEPEGAEKIRSFPFTFTGLLVELSFNSGHQSFGAGAALYFIVQGIFDAFFKLIGLDAGHTLVHVKPEMLLRLLVCFAIQYHLDHFHALGMIVAVLLHGLRLLLTGSLGCFR